MHFVSVISKIFFRSKAKLIWWHHHYPWYYSINANFYTKSKRFIEKLFVKNIDLLIANSEYLKQSIKDIYKIDSKILHPVLDDKFLNYTPSLIFPINREKNNSKVIFSYGRWVEGKNLGLVFEVYEGLKDRINNLVLMI
jgi:glycosyltransferase involved in cell wall biosynthesis